MTEPLASRSSPHGWRIGTLGGVPVYLGRSWPIIAIAIVAFYGPSLARQMPAAEAYLFAFTYAVLLLLSVLLHEAAHAVAARWRGQRVDRVVADMWGGHTVYDATGSTAGTTALVAFVGPLTNLLIGGVGWLFVPLVDGTPLRLLWGVIMVNLFVGVFNLIPGLPMDGGQIVSALIWKATGRRSTGLVIAGWMGRAVALSVFVWQGVLPLFEGEALDLGILLWGLIALFLWRGASEAIRSGPLLDATAGPMRDVLDPAVGVSVHEPIESAVQRAISSGTPVVAVVTDAAGIPVGTMDPEAALAVAEGDRATVPVAAVYVAQPAAWVVRLPARASLADLVRAMVTSSLSAAAVVDVETGALLGVARAERMNEFIESALVRRTR